MTMQDPTLAHAELAIEEAELIDGGPAVSWGAIFAGALSAAALSFVLLAVGAAFGLSVTSPWDFTGRDAGETAAAVGIGTAIFLIVVHAITSGVGGYLAGRLRSKLIGLRGDETYFRDTAHGLVVWAVSALTTILMIACLAFATARGGVALGAASLNAAGQAAGAAAPALIDETGQDNIGYFIDTLFRPTGGAPATTEGQAQTGGAATPPMALPEPRSDADVRMEREEIGRIVRVALDGEISAEDRTYVAQIVARESGVPQAEAEQRVDQMIERAKAAQAEAVETAKQAADAARQAGTYTALWAAVAMLAGAFTASLAATWGGRARDL
ncbi:MAG TPA: hypothetical protein VJ790_04825 [Dongiaceae bacterium]|nr:hypothetical protein [Dongiaceae bacterium]